MTPFCTDVDLLQWEPDVLRNANFVSQTLLAGTGTLTGTSFSISSGSFTDAGVEKDHVIVFTGDSPGCFPILSIDSATSLTMSALSESTVADPPVPAPPSETGSQAFVIRTFWPQRMIVSELLSQAAGNGTIINASSLRRACALGTLQMIYSALAAASPDDPHFDVRAQMYERLYRRAIRNAIVDVDTNGDGVADAHRALSVLSFRRS